MNNIEKIIREVKPNITTNTLKSYVNNIKKIFRELEQDNIDIFNELDIIRKYIDTKKSYLTKRNYLNSIIVLLQHDNMKNKEILKEYIKIRDEYNQKYKDDNKDNKKTEKQINNWVTLKELEFIKYDLSKNLDDEQTLIHHFMLSFWLEYPIRNDLHNTLIINRKKYNKLLQEELEKQNYLVLDKIPFISISQYKTFKKYGIKKIMMNDEIQNVLINYLKRNKTKYILYNIKDKSPMTTEDITNNFNKLFHKYYPEKQISTTMLRHIITSEKYGEILQEMKDFADIMGHDISTAHNIYIKK